MARLYKARIEYEVVVLAENENEARRIIEQDAGYYRSEPDYANGPAVVHDAREVPHDWRGAIPWGEKRDRTVAQILDERRNDGE